MNQNTQTICHHPTPSTINPLFSIIMPVYNGSTFLRIALDSVYAQQCDSYELIVVNDGSTDGTREILDQYLPEIHVIDQSHTGIGVARNRGSIAAAGEYLAFIDADDVWFPHTLCVIEHLARTHKPAIITSQPLMFERDTELTRARHQRLDCTIHPSFMHAIKPPYPFWGGCTLIIRRDVFHRLGGFWTYPANGSDTDLLLRAGAYVGPYVYIRRPHLIGYRQHPGAVTRNPARVRHARRLMRMRERKGVYPNDTASRAARQQLIAYLHRNDAMRLLCSRHHAQAWMSYVQGLTSQLRCRRFRYLAGFPPLMVMARTGRAQRWLHTHR